MQEAQPERAASTSARPLALVTGASSGIGAAFTHALAARNCDLVLVARRKDRLDALGAELEARYKISAQSIVADLSIVDAHIPVLEALGPRANQVTWLVNNAGYSLPKTYLAHSWAEQRDFVMTLVMAACGLTHAFLPGMIARRQGHVIFVGSMAGLSPGGAGHTLYPAAKSFVNKFARSLDAELRDKNIRFTCVNPGFTESEFTIANATQHKMEDTPRTFMMTAEKVVHDTLEANDRGKVICIPGLHNKIAAAFMKYLPDGITAPLIRMGAEKYRIPD